MAATLIPPQAENLFEVKSVWSHTHTHLQVIHINKLFNDTARRRLVYFSMYTPRHESSFSIYLLPHEVSEVCERVPKSILHFCFSPLFSTFSKTVVVMYVLSTTPSSAIDNTKDRRINESLLVS